MGVGPSSRALGALLGVLLVVVACGDSGSAPGSGAAGDGSTTTARGAGSTSGSSGSDRAVADDTLVAAWEGLVDDFVIDLELTADELRLLTEEICEEVEERVAEAGGDTSAFLAESAISDFVDERQIDVMVGLLNPESSPRSAAIAAAIDVMTVEVAASVTCPEYEELGRIAPDDFLERLAQLAVLVPFQIDELTVYVMRDYLDSTFTTDTSQAIDDFAVLDAADIVCDALDEEFSFEAAEAAAKAMLVGAQQRMGDAGLSGFTTVVRESGEMARGRELSALVAIQLAVAWHCSEYLADWHAEFGMGRYALREIWGFIFIDFGGSVVTSDPIEPGIPPTALITIRSGSFTPTNVDLDPEKYTEIRWTNTDEGTTYVIELITLDMESPPIAPGESWTLSIEDLEPGLYRFRITVGNVRAQGTFEILD